MATYIIPGQNYLHSTINVCRRKDKVSARLLQVPHQMGAKPEAQPEGGGRVFLQVRVPSVQPLTLSALTDGHLLSVRCQARFWGFKDGKSLGTRVLRVGEMCCQSREHREGWGVTGRRGDFREGTPLELRLQLRVSVQEAGGGQGCPSQSVG